ncbi:MAG: signal peptidase II [Lachnospiraceae bacterium]|nr:signal peptidase II [Lachnospiraceae bacterium]
MIYVFIIAVLFLLDLFVKNYIEKNKELGKEEVIIKDKLSIRYIRNKGAIYSTFEDKSAVVRGLSAFLIVLMWIVCVPMFFKKGNQGMKLGLAFIMAGGMSNVYDRIKRKYVVDYIHWNKLKKIIFNISDVFIVTGGIITIICSFVKESVKH